MTGEQAAWIAAYGGVMAAGNGRGTAAQEAKGAVEEYRKFFEAEAAVCWVNKNGTAEMISRAEAELRESFGEKGR